MIFSGIALYYGDTYIIIQTWNIIARPSTNECSECALPQLAWQRYFISGFQLLALVVQATNIGARCHGYEARAEPHKMGNACTTDIQDHYYCITSTHACTSVNYCTYNICGHKLSTRLSPLALLLLLRTRNNTTATNS